MTTTMAPVNGGSRITANEPGRLMEYVPFGQSDKIKLTVRIIQDMICVKTKSGQVCSDTDALKFMMKCQAKKINPFDGDAFMIGYDTKDGPVFADVTAHQAFLKRAENHPEYDGMESGVIVIDPDGNVVDREGDFFFDDDTIIGGWATVHFKNRKYPMKKRLRLKAFHKGTKIWNENPGGMIVKCFDEETEVLTTNGFEKFADATGGILQVTDRGLEETDSRPFYKAYSGPMVHFKSRNGNFMVTPNHDIPIEMNGSPEMKVEAEGLLHLRQRDKAVMPLALNGSKRDTDICDESIRLVAAYIADGSDNSRSSGFSISVSRPTKVAFLKGLGAHTMASVREDAGREARMRSGRSVITKSNKTAFYYSRTADINRLVGRGKVIDQKTVLSLSKRQAKLFLDTWIAMDGHRGETLRCGRVYTSRLDHVRIIELLAVIAGYAISGRSSRQSEGNKVNYSLTVTNRTATRVAIGELESIPNPGDGVWCVTVPTHKIIVRRNGFSHVCYQCSEADALRSSFPTLLGGLYSEEERSPPVVVEAPAAEMKAGRQRITGTRKPAQEEQSAPSSPANNETFAADGSEPAVQAAEPEAVKDKVLNFLDAIEQTTTKAGLTKIGSELKAAEKALGEGHKEVMDAWRKKYQALSDAK